MLTVSAFQICSDMLFVLDGSVLTDILCTLP